MLFGTIGAAAGLEAPSDIDFNAKAQGRRVAGLVLALSGARHGLEWPGVTF